jgi:hypothetical protein
MVKHPAVQRQGHGGLSPGSSDTVQKEVEAAATKLEEVAVEVLDLPVPVCCWRCFVVHKKANLKSQTRR